VTARPKAKLAELTAESIKKDIVKLGWPVGELLGNEPDFQRRYSVSRATLREAIRQLQQHGVVTMRRGSPGGLVITAPARISAVRAMVNYLQLIDARIEELFEARLAVESMAVEYAAQSFPDEKLAEARHWIAELHTAPIKGIEEETAFHAEVTSFLNSCDKNQATVLLLETLYLLTTSMQRTQKSPGERDSIFAELRKTRAGVLSAIIDGDIDGAKSETVAFTALSRQLFESQSQAFARSASARKVGVTIYANLPGHNVYTNKAHALAITIARDLSGLKPGNHVGIEPELQAKYSVSRAVLREALRILEVHSIIITRRGANGGLLVAEPHPDYTISIVMSYLRYCKFGPHFFFDVWKAILVTVSHLAASRITAADRDGLLANLKRTQQAAPDKYFEAARQLEMAISDAARNRVLRLFSHVMVGMAGSYGMDASPPPEVVQKLAAQQTKVVNAIIMGEAGMAKRGMLRYLNFVSAWFGPSVRSEWLSRLRK
jgi:DNA-binding FadR family transcriptional regulator